MISKKKLLTIVVFFGLLSNVYSSNVEVNLNLTSTFDLIQQSDSTLVKIYDQSLELYRKREYTRALQKALDLLQLAKKENDMELVSKTNYLIGKIWFDSKSYKKAITYFRQSLEDFTFLIKVRDSLSESPISTKYNDHTYLENNYNIGKSYHQLFENVEDEDPLKEEKEKVYKDSLQYYYDIVLNSKSFDKDIDLLKSQTYNNLSGVYLRDSLFQRAEKYALEALDIKKKFGDPYLLASAYNTLSNIHFFNEEFEKSKFELERGIDIMEKLKGERADQIRADLYYNLAYTMYMLEDYEAYQWQGKAYDIYDSINELNRERELTRITQEKNFDLGRLYGIQQEEIKKQKAQTVSWIIGISSFFVIVLLVFFLNQYKLRQKNLNLEMTRKELEQQRKLERIKADSQIRILNATLDGKESERKQIAETLHDSVSALLSSANLHLQACKTQFNGSTPIEVDKSQSIINEASQKIRDLSHTLVSSILLKFGLSFAIKDIAEKFSNSELKIDYDTRYIKRYDQGFEIKLYNIIQEFINNILKHSHASHAKITLVEKKKKLHLIIEDNGQGFDTAQIPEKDGLGINQIDARIQMMKGKFTIETAKGKGTKIIIELPVFEKEPTISISIS